MKKTKTATSLQELSETELVNRKLDRLDKEIRSGKSKLLNSDEALGSYAKYLKPKLLKPLKKKP